MTLICKINLTDYWTYCNQLRESKKFLVNELFTFFTNFDTKIQNDIFLKDHKIENNWITIIVGPRMH